MGDVDDGHAEDGEDGDEGDGGDGSTQIVHQISRSFHIDAGHRIYGHEGKCKSLHGHGYTFEVIAIGPRLDSLGRVIDFSVMKDVIGTWIEENLDHAMILFAEDPVVDLYRESEILKDDKVYILDANPTAENLAEFVLIKSNQLMKDNGHEITIIAVKCHETPKCNAVAMLSQLYSE